MMKILFASPHRDLLQAYERILREEKMEVTTAFDGTQVFHSVSASRPDFAILDQTIPRISSERILEYLSEEKIPVIELLPGRLVTAFFLKTPLPQAFLSFPFSPKELIECIRDLEWLLQKEAFSFGGVTVDPAAFLLNGSVRLTSSEILLLEAAKSGAVQTDRKLCCVTDALNEKLKTTDTRIRWREGRGWEWRMKDE